MRIMTEDLTRELTRITIEPHPFLYQQLNYYLRRDITQKPYIVKEGENGEEVIEKYSGIRASMHLGTEVPYIGFNLFALEQMSKEEGKSEVALSYLQTDLVITSREASTRTLMAIAYNIHLDSSDSEYKLPVLIKLVNVRSNGSILATLKTVPIQNVSKEVKKKAELTESLIIESIGIHKALLNYLLYFINKQQKADLDNLKGLKITGIL